MASTAAPRTRSGPDTPDDAPADRRGTGRTGSRVVTALLGRRAPALVAVLAVVAVSLAFTFLWGPVVRHQAFWVVPGDVWWTFRNAHFVGWGDIGDVYQPQYGLLTFPAVVVVLAPVAMVSGHFGLTESIGYLTVSHPSAWFLLGPASLLLGASCLVPFDSLAEELGVAPGKRIPLLAAEGAVVFEVVTLWGHPEDMAAVGLAVYGLLCGRHSRWRPAGWLWGAAIAFQPLVLVLFPLAFATTAPRQRLRLVVRSVVPSAILLTLPLATRWAQTTGTLLHQANRIDLDHPTPWIAFSAHLAPSEVSAGPGRIIALVVAAGLGWLAWRRRPTLYGLVWLGALALALRCFFESVMVPFYLGPPFALLLLAASVRPGRWRLAVTSASLVVSLVVATHYLAPWDYWLPMVGLLAVGLACGWPGGAAFGSGRPARTGERLEDTIGAEGTVDDGTPVLSG